MPKLSLQRHTKKRILQTGFILLFVGVGIYLTLMLRAASPEISIEPENTAGTDVAVISDASASNGKYVRFGALSGNNRKPVVVGHSLQLGTTGQQLRMHGVCVWGMQDNVQSFEAGQYANRQKIVNNIKSWGANEVRFQLNSQLYYNQSSAGKANQLQHMKEWHDLVTGAGMYFHVAWWDSHNKGADWATKYSETFGMMTDVFNTLGNDPMVIYEPFNEPHHVSTGQWLTAFKATLNHFRTTLGYNGILAIDTIEWSNHYNDSVMTQLEQYDSTLKGMNGKHQLIFAKHDYADFNNPDMNAPFDVNRWIRGSTSNGGTNWDFKKHLVWETEFGNESMGKVWANWSAGASTWMADKTNDGTLVGGTGFLYGPWVDRNGMTAADNVTPTQWGGYVKNNFLLRVK